MGKGVSKKLTGVDSPGAVDPMSSTSFSYRLELLPTADGRSYYKGQVFTSNENAGVDLFVVKDIPSSCIRDFSEQKTPLLLDLGVSARLVKCFSDGTEEDVHYWLCPRSSIFKSGLVMANSQGVIDRTYRGTLKAPVWAISNQTFLSWYEQTSLEGTRLFQIVAPDMGFIREVKVVESLSITERGAGGFGSTGTS